MLNSRNYVVTDPGLAGYVQRNGKSFAFYPLIVEVTRRLIAFDKEATRVTFANMNTERGPGGLMAAVHDMMIRHLSPGPSLDSLTQIQLEHIALMLNDMESEMQVSLYRWLRHIFSECNMQAVYGPRNIFATHPELEAAFWDFEDGMLGLVVDIFPKVTARKAYNARNKVLKALAAFVRDGSYKQASPLIRERVDTNLRFGMSERMAGHAELILLFGIMGNAVPSLFWLIAMMFSNPKLLSEIRTEVEKALGPEAAYSTSEESSKTDQRIITVSSKVIQPSCPLLYSCYRETLRYISLLTSPRLVLEDTVLGDKYMLRKGSVVMIAGGVIHYDQRVWGFDASSFNPYRFMNKNFTSDSPSANKVDAGCSPGAWPLPRGVPSPAFRAFGGGTVICPGRHFAQSELMTIAAVLAIGFDISNADGSTLQVPEKDETRIPLSVMKPVVDPDVQIRKRAGYEDMVWDVRV